MDMLQAKRASFAAERVARERERKERERLDGIQRELQQARLTQKAEKEARLGEQAKAERDQYERIAEAQIKMDDAETARQASQKVLRDKHARELRSQIECREEKGYQDRRDVMEQGNNMRSEAVKERARLESLKARKIDEMLTMGVPDKYLTKVRGKRACT